MSDRKFADGVEFETPDGRIEIVGVARDHDRVVYSVEYKDVSGQPTSTLAEEELENNENISKV